MRILIVLSICFLIVYLPLDGFFLKWIPLSGQSLIIISQLPDLLVFILFLGTAYLKYIKRDNFRLIGNHSDRYLISFTLLSFLVALIIRADFFTVLINLKALLRYILVTYIILNLELKHFHLRILLRTIVFALLFQMLLGGMQLFASPAFKLFFLPPIIQDEIGGIGITPISYRELMSNNAIFGTMDKTIEYGMFLLVGQALWMAFNHKYRGRYWLGIIFFVILIYGSSSRSSLLTSFLLIFSYQFYLGTINKKFLLALLVIFIIVPILVLYITIANIDYDKHDFLFAFTTRYIEIAQKQRLGIAMTMLPNFFNSDLINVVFGFSADREILMERFIQIKDRPGLLNSDARHIEDVYWVALIYYYGVLGMILFLMFLRKIWKLINAKLHRLKNVTDSPFLTAALLLLFIAIPLNLFNQAFEVRTYSFYLWLILGLGLEEARMINFKLKNKVN